MTIETCLSHLSPYPQHLSLLDTQSLQQILVLKKCKTYNRYCWYKEIVMRQSYLQTPLSQVGKQKCISK